jgi:DNA-binding transcriptional ArsR family regulator
LKEGKTPKEKGIRNRRRLVMELLNSPSTFTTLKKKLKVSGKTLAVHLKSLQNQGLLKREIQGKYIVYIIAKPQTVLDMRKDCLKELLELGLLYSSCLDNETTERFNETARALQKSIVTPKTEAEASKVFEPHVTDKVFGRTIRFSRKKKRGR